MRMRVCPRFCSQWHWSMSVWGATAQKSLMMPATDDYIKPSMRNQQHNRVGFVSGVARPTSHPFSKLLILLRGSWRDRTHPSVYGGMLPVYHTANIHIDKHIHTLIHTYRQFKVSSEWTLHVFWCVGGIQSPPWACIQTREHGDTQNTHSSIYSPVDKGRDCTW